MSLHPVYTDSHRGRVNFSVTSPHFTYAILDGRTGEPMAVAMDYEAATFERKMLHDGAAHTPYIRPLHYR